MSLKTNIVKYAEDLKKGIEDAGSDALKVASFLSAHASEISGLAALTGPTGSSVAAVATTVLGKVVQAIEDAGSSASSNGLSVSLDAQTIADVKAVVAAIEKL
jgi:hypothetical protein